MSDKALRKKLIRLAHSNPELRADILPLLKESASKKASLPNAELSTLNGKRVPSGREPGTGRYLVSVDGYGVMRVELNESGLISTERVNAAAAKRAGLKPHQVTKAAVKAVKQANPSLFQYSRLAKESASKKASMRNVYKNFPRNSFFYRFFEEKDIPDRVFDVEDSTGMSHSIPNSVVVEHIAQASRREQKQIEGILRKIDFANGDVNHFLKHMAGAVADSYSGALRFARGDFTLARFEKGKPADPTKNMSPEDAEKWRANTEKYRDKFTKGARGKQASRSYLDYLRKAEAAFLKQAANLIKKFVGSRGDVRVHEGVAVTFLEYKGVDRSDLELEIMISISSVNHHTTKVFVSSKSPFSGAEGYDVRVKNGNLTTKRILDMFVDAFGI